jgi:hypothetical protein
MRLHRDPEAFDAGGARSVSLRATMRTPLPGCTHQGTVRRAREVNEPNGNRGTRFHGKRISRLNRCTAKNDDLFNLL